MRASAYCSIGTAVGGVKPFAAEDEFHGLRLLRSSPCQERPWAEQNGSLALFFFFEARSLAGNAHFPYHLIPISAIIRRMGG
ncbi:MAG: hypothetical protein IAE79_02210 [Anaerolinea sp.]|nr:hypothetical protein [Anaerolinea sp.]